MKKDVRFRKYEFDSKEEFELKKAELDALQDDETNPIRQYYGIVELGHIVTKEGEYDEDGNEIKAPTYSPKYHVDVFWYDQEPEDWKGKKIKLEGKKESHTFVGIEYEDD